MNNEKELFDLAKQYVMLDNELRKDRLPEYELDEIKEGLEEIRNTILNKGYNVDKFVEYQLMYRKFTIAEYFEFINKL